jgi:hypothetical protein
MLRVWFAKEEDAVAGIRPLAEAPVPKDRWISPDAEVVSYPPMPNEVVEHSAQILFSGVSQGARVPHPEIPGGYI